MTNGSSVILLTEYNQDEFHLLHAQTVENTMRYFARELGFADEEDFWGIVGLLHDLGFEKVLYAVDELTGLIGAVVLMRPSKSVQDLTLKSVKKKYKSKNFAAGCSREVIERGADMLGWTLEDLIQRTIDALKTFQD